MTETLVYIETGKGSGVLTYIGDSPLTAPESFKWVLDRRLGLEALLSIAQKKRWKVSRL